MPNTPNKQLLRRDKLGSIFEGGRIISNAGGQLLRELDYRYRLTNKAVHNSRKLKHDLLTLVRQRLFAIPPAYEDNNDAATLARELVPIIIFGVNSPVSLNAEAMIQ
jgi:hypothetical protein